MTSVLVLVSLIVWGIRLEGRLDQEAVLRTRLEIRFDQELARSDRTADAIKKTLDRLDDKMTTLLLRLGSHQETRP